MAVYTSRWGWDGLSEGVVVRGSAVRRAPEPAVIIRRSGAMGCEGA